MTRSILITGKSGFLGKKIFEKFSLYNYKVLSLGRNINDEIRFDLLSDNIRFENSFDLIIHSAGKAHSIPKTKDQNKEFYNINVKGTENLLEGLERSRVPPKSFVFISSVAVYGLETGNSINENSPLLVKDVYGDSKIRAEQIVWNWCKKNKVVCSILRLPLLAGSNPPGNLGNMIKGIKLGYYFNIDGGKAQKSMVLAEDVAKIIPFVANIGGVYNLTDRHHPTFSELSELIAQQLGKSKPLNIPHWIAKLMAKAGDLVGSKAPINSKKLSKITSDLTFDDSKAVAAFGWNPTPVLSGFKIS